MHRRASDVADLGPCVNEGHCDSTFGWRAREGVAGPSVEDDKAYILLRHQKPARTYQKGLFIPDNFGGHPQGHISSGGVHGRHRYDESNNTRKIGHCHMPEPFASLVGVSKRER